MTQLDYAGLYGGAVQGSPRTARLVVPRGTTPAGPWVLPFVVAAVQVDNASGSWYLVGGRRVPPWTVSAVVALDTPSSQIEIESAAPGGQLPEAVGEDLVLVATEAALPPFPGIYTPPAIAIAFQTASATYTLTTSGGPATDLQLVAQPTDPENRYVVTRFDVTIVGTARANQGRLSMQLGNQDAFGVTLPRAHLGLAQEKPSDSLGWAPGALRWPSPAELAGSGQLANLSIRGLQPALWSPVDLFVTVQYYEVAT